MNKEYGVIWDFDGVIFDSVDIQLKVWKKTFRKFGVNMDDDEYIQNFGRSDIFHTICTHHKAKISYEDWNKKRKKFYFTALDTEIKPMPGVKKLLEDLKRKNYSIAVATSTNRDIITHILEKLKLKEYFDVILTGEDIINSKPSPEIFMKAARIMVVDRKKCLVIEDSKFGVKAAKTAGMKCIAVTGAKKFYENLDMADLIVKDLMKITPNKIKNLLNSQTQ